MFCNMDDYKGRKKAQKMTGDKMKAVICDGYGDPKVLKIEIVNKPAPGSDELLIKIVAATVNSGDVRVRALKGNLLFKIAMVFMFGFGKPRNPVLGTVYAGIVEQTGCRVKDFKTGDEVFGMTGFKFGTHAEYISVKENSVLSHKPHNASFEEAAALLFGGQAAHYFLHKTSIVNTPGLSILIYGATGATGTSALQIAKYYKANVTAVCSDYNEKLAIKLGADNVLFYNKEDLTKTDKKYDIIFDAVGKLSKRECAHLLKDGGDFCTVGGLEYARESIEQVRFLKDLFEKGNYDAVIDRVYHMDEIMEAHAYVDSGRKKGNVVLKITR